MLNNILLLFEVLTVFDHLKALPEAADTLKHEVLP